MKEERDPLHLLLDRAGVFHQSFLQSHDAILICDGEARIRMVNEAFTELYGFDQEELMGANMAAEPEMEQSAPNNFTPEIWEELLDPATGVWRGEIRHAKKDGEPIYVKVKISTIRGGEGDIAAFLSIASDVSEKIQIEKKFVQQEKLFSIGLLSSGIAHEIGSPLNVISGRAEMLKSYLKDMSPEVGKSLRIIIQQTERISELIKALLNFSRPDSKKSPEDFTEIDLKKVLGECRKLLQVPMKGLGVSLSVKNHTDATVKWDFFKCEQVFFNLLQNAIHAVGKSKEPAIEVIFRPGDIAEKSLLERPFRSCLAVEVTDNGCGIPSQYLTRIFDPFFTTKEVGMGTGLGLSVVYGLVKEADGVIKAESTVGEGSTFTLILPAAAARGESEPQGEEGEPVAS